MKIKRVMIEEQAITSDPFAPSEIDEESELRAITRALQLAEGFKLIFARCNQAPHRKELIESLRASLHDFNIQEVHLDQPVPHLLNELRTRITTPAPAAIFVSGIEHSLPIAAEAHNTPFVANLNAARDSFRHAIPCPMVLWVPEYVLTAILRGAPDFFSIRSGVYYFSLSAQEVTSLVETLPSENYLEIGELSYEEKLERLATINSLLADYEALPENKRDYQTEIRLHSKVADLSYVLGHFDDAISHTKSNLKLSEILYGNLHLETAAILNNLAEIYRERRHFEEAECLFKQVLEIDVKLLGDFHPETATTLSNLALLYEVQGRHEEAEPLFKHALEIDMKFLKGFHPETATTLNNLAELYRAQRRYEEAEPLYKQSLKIKETILGKEHPNIATSLNNLGLLYQAQGQYKKAEPFLKRALELWENSLGKEHPYSVIGLNNLAELYRAEGRYKEAEPLYKQASEINEKILGKDHPLTVKVRNDLQNFLEETTLQADKHT